MVNREVLTQYEEGKQKVNKEIKKNTLAPKQAINIRKGFKEFCHLISSP